MDWARLNDLAPGAFLGASAWKSMTQDRVNDFAGATDDFQFVHVDEARAAAETPFGGTIAHGFLTLAMISSLASEVLPDHDSIRAVMLIGIDRVKFLNPVRIGRRIRATFHFGRVAWMKPDCAVIKVQVVIEIDGESKPALSCDVSWMIHFHADADTGSRAESSPAV